MTTWLIFAGPSQISIKEEANSFPCRCLTRPFGAPSVFPCGYWLISFIRFLQFLEFCSLYGIRMTAPMWEFGLLFKSFCIKSNPCSFGLVLNKKRCGLLFMDFPSEIHRLSNGLELLGSPVWGSDDFYDSCFASRFYIFIHLPLSVSSVSKAECRGTMSHHHHEDSLSDCGWGIIAVLSFIIFHCCQLWNNLSSCNLLSMVAEFLESIGDVRLPWVVENLVERVFIDPNLYNLYLDFLDSLVDSSLDHLILQETFKCIGLALHADW